MDVNLSNEMQRIDLALGALQTPPAVVRSYESLNLNFDFKFTIGLAERPQDPIANASSLEELLTRRVKNSKMPELAQALSANSGYTIAQRMRILSVLPKEEVHAFFRDLIKHFRHSYELQHFVSTKINAMARCMPGSQIGEVVSDLIEQNDANAGVRVSKELVRSFNTCSDLAAIVQSAGQAKLLALNEKTITDLVALNAIKSSIPNLPSDLINDASSPSMVESAHRSTLKFLKQLRANILVLKEFERTRSYRQYLEIANSHLHVLDTHRYAQMSLDDKRDEMKFVSAALKIELQYKVLFVNTYKDREHAARHWKTAEVSEIGRALGMMPEGVVLTTPGAFKLVRIDRFIDNEWMAARRESNADVTFADTSVTLGSLCLSCLHEWGHLYQLGDPTIGQLAGERNLFAGDQRADFIEYAAIHEIKAIESNRFSWKDSYTIVFDNKEYHDRAPKPSSESDWIVCQGDGFLLVGVRAPKSKQPLAYIPKGELYIIGKPENQVSEYSLRTPREAYAEGWMYFWADPSKLPDAERLFFMSRFSRP